MKWVAVVVEVPAEAADELAGRVAVGTLGVEVLGGARSERRILRVYVPAGEEPGVLATVRALDDVRGVGVEPVEDGDWVERYQRGLRPFPLGARFLVVPGDTAPGEARRQIIRLVPGRAFGTGEHPTTRLCAEALESEVHAGSRWLDAGTGSGILAVVAVACGAGSVTAIDIDPEAVDVAREVLAANGVAQRVELSCGGLSTAAGAGYDGVVANVSAPFFLERAVELVGLLGEGGVLVASGFGPADRAEVFHTLCRAGFHELGARELDGWVLGVFEAGR